MDKSHSIPNQDNIHIDYKDVGYLSRFISFQGTVLPHHVSGVPMSRHKKIVEAVKRARHLALLPIKETD